METKTYSVPGIHCHHCIHTVTMELSDLEGVKNVEANLETKLVTVTFEAPATEELIIDTLAEINYPVAE